MRGEVTVFGCDYAWGRPGTAALQKAGVKFAARYLSYDTTGKNLTRSEAAALSRAGIWIVVVWEQTASRVLGGKTAGASDAREAARQAKVCGMPDDRPIYFAVDFEATAGQQPTVNAYLDGAASVIGRERVGLYAGYGPIKRAFDAGKIAYGWQTYAWSGGAWDPRAQLQQYSNDHRINGVGLDYDRAVKSDYGQWKVGVSPAKEDDMQLDDSVPVGKTYAGDFAHDSYPFSFVAVGAFAEAKRARVAAEAGNAALGEMAKTLAALAADRGQQVDADALVQRIEQAIENVTVRLDVQDGA